MRKLFASLALTAAIGGVGALEARGGTTSTASCPPKPPCEVTLCYTATKPCGIKVCGAAGASLFDGIVITGAQINVPSTHGGCISVWSGGRCYGKISCSTPPP